MFGNQLDQFTVFRCCVVVNFHNTYNNTYDYTTVLLTRTHGEAQADKEGSKGETGDTTLSTTGCATVPPAGVSERS